MTLKLRETFAVATSIVLALVSTMCGGSGTSAGSAAIPEDAAADRSDVAAPGADAAAQLPSCSAAFGPVVSLASAAIGAHVVLEGVLSVAPNILKPLPTGSTCTDASRGVELIGADAPNDPVFVRGAPDGDDAFCGCPATDSMLCSRLAFGPKVRVRGTVQDTGSSGPCNQAPCRRILFEDICVPQ